MKQLLNTLFVLSTGSKLSRDGACILLEAPSRPPMRIPAATLDGVVCMAGVNHTPPLLDLCVEHGVSLTYLSEYGRFIARMEGPVSGNVLLRRDQYRQADIPEKLADIARDIITGKLANARQVLMRGARETADAEKETLLRQATERIDGIRKRLVRTLDLESLRGLEGEAGAVYWGVFGALLVNADPAFTFTTRNRRPPKDPTNALLSFLYTLLMHDVRSALEGVGLDPQAGFLHRFRPGRASLALDLMEEFRAPVVDRLVLSLINRGQLAPGEFKQESGGGVIMSDDARRIVITAYQKRKQEEIVHPFLQEKMPWGLLWHAQARLFARHIRGELDGYPVFFWK
ncbi:MAG: type I-C CRISPR-associated endonuclease Cas1 [Magnetococcales bacterium]|nr:type I-C CRISPR-associated endonuclease Cas1 [Magnetococcales bacterium]